MSFEPGMSNEVTIIVDETQIAASFKEARLAPVLSTPHLI